MEQTAVRDFFKLSNARFWKLKTRATMPSHDVTVPNHDELEGAVQYHKTSYSLLERHNDHVIMLRSPKPIWKYLRDILIYGLLTDVPNAGGVTPCKSVRNIPAGTDKVIIRVAAT